MKKVSIAWAREESILDELSQRSALCLHDFRKVRVQVRSTRDLAFLAMTS